jgi:hypothetical protein
MLKRACDVPSTTSRAIPRPPNGFMTVQRCAGCRSGGTGFETVFSHGSNLAFLRALKSLGYDVHLHFVCTDDPQINIDRVRNRVSLGQHSVPEEKIRERYWRTLELLSLGILDMDRTLLYDNSMNISPGGSEALHGRLICEVCDGGPNPSSHRVSLVPPIPYWALGYALFPFAFGWHQSATYKEFYDRFAADAECGVVSNPDDPGERSRFLQQFRR